MPIPLAYLITFGCYGARLHGSEAGSVDRFHNRINTPLVPGDALRESRERQRMKGYAYEMDEQRRAMALEAIVELCVRRSWQLHAAHVRTKHLHLVVSGDESPERIIRDAKVAASRRLDRSRVDKPGTKRWAHHGSTRYLWKAASVSAAVEYVVYQQGAPMAVWKQSAKQSEPRP